MAQKLSQLYDVDNRYREAKGVSDNNAGKAFLQQFRARDKELAKDPVEPSRREDNRFILPSQNFLKNKNRNYRSKYFFIKNRGI